jgi:hypothetical protein
LKSGCWYPDCAKGFCHEDEEDLKKSIDIASGTIDLTVAADTDDQQEDDQQQEDEKEKKKKDKDKEKARKKMERQQEKAADIAAEKSKKSGRSSRKASTSKVEICGNTNLVFFCSRPQNSTKTGSLKFGNK